MRGIDHRFLRRLRTLGIIEGISTLVLFGIAMPLKYAAGIPLAVTIVGSIHGFLFLALTTMFVLGRTRIPISTGLAATGVAAAVVPFGPFLLDNRLERVGASLAPSPDVPDKPFRVTAVLLALALIACATAASAPRSRPSTFAAVVIDLTNAERTRARRPALASSLQLMRAAQLHAEQMAHIGRLDHVLSGVNYPRPEDRLAGVGYDWQAWAENVAFGQEHPKEVLQSWMRSAGHRQNMMNASLTEVGAGYATDRRGRAYWVQVFARPISSR